MKESIREKYLPEFVYGGIDGAITTLAVMAGAMGASLHAGIILILGFANLTADGFSMAVSNYLSTKSQRELSINKTKQYKKSPLKTGFATFISFIAIGLIPLIPFIIGLISPFVDLYKFNLSIVFTAIALIVVGSIKGQITKKKPLKSAIETLLIGGIAASLAFIVGYLLKGVLV